MFYMRRLAALKHLESVQSNTESISRHLSAVEAKYTAALEEIRMLRNRPVEHVTLEADSQMIKQYVHPVSIGCDVQLMEFC